MLLWKIKKGITITNACYKTLEKSKSERRISEKIMGR